MVLLLFNVLGNLIDPTEEHMKIKVASIPPNTIFFCSQRIKVLY